MNIFVYYHLRLVPLLKSVDFIYVSLSALYCQFYTILYKSNLLVGPMFRLMVDGVSKLSSIEMFDNCQNVLFILLVLKHL